MDSSQFKKWLGNHLKRFNSIEAWLNKKPEKAGGEATAKEILQTWFEVLADVRIDDAIWASEQMFKGELPQPQGPGFDDHPRTVRRYAIERARTRSASTTHRRGPDGERIYDCLHCEDRGVAVIWCPPFLEVVRELFGAEPPVDYFNVTAYREHPNGGKAYKTIACACSCPRGQAKKESLRGRRDPFYALTFDPAKHVIWKGHARSALVEALATPLSQQEF